ncbi:MAG: Ig-like domain repeat protein [Acidobacteriota bacterium]
MSNGLPFSRRFARRFAVALAAAGLIAFSGRLLAQSPAEAAVQVSAAVQKTPTPKITLSWPPDGTVSQFDVYRKSISATAWGAPVVSLPGSATTWDDNAVAVGVLYEYRVSAQKSIVGEGYVVSGIEVPLVESRGKVVLIVDATYASALATELALLQEDLIGDGWTVIRHDVSRSETVPNVKALILADYAADPSHVQAVFLFGHVPVPYSGAYAPDDHFTEHFGAWPADLFYGDMDGVWTDTQDFDTTNPGRQHNVAGDGKYDQSDIPSDVELEVGRVDLSDLPVLAPKTELDLLRQYLNKDHAFRHGITRAQGRGLVDDNFGYYVGEMFASSAYRNFSAFFGASNVFDLDWFTTLPTQSYLWAYGSGGSANGRYTSAQGVGSTADFGAQDPKAVFTMLFGSWFGDWDTTDNFMRAPLAGTTYGLTDAWAGRPAWYFQHMGMGETVGYGTRLSQNNDGLYWNDPDLSFARQIHIALMGDPTLRMHVIAPVSGLSAAPSGHSLALSWTASPDAVLGYHVYRAASPAGPFARVNGALVTGTTYTDDAVAGGPAGAYTWAVRAVRLETGSGTYFNASQARFVSATAGTPSGTTTSLASSSNPSPLGQSVTFTATVSSTAGGPYTGNVTFRDGASVLGTGAVSAGGQASLATSALTVGSHAITAAYGGDARLDPSTSSPFAQSVKIATTTALRSSANPSPNGQPVTFTASVTGPAGPAPTGTVTFSDGVALLGTAALDASGNASLTISKLATGGHTIQASYSGDANRFPSSAPPLAQTISSGSSTSLNSSPNPSRLAQPVTFTAVVSSSSGSPTGTVRFLEGAQVLATASIGPGGQASTTLSGLAIGGHSVTASYGGDATFPPSNSSPLVQVVQDSAAISLSTSAEPSFPGQAVTFAARVSPGHPPGATPTGTVSFFDGAASLGAGSLVSGRATLSTSTLAVGLHRVTAVYSGDAAFSTATSSARSQIVTPSANHTDFDGDGKSDLLWRNGSSGGTAIWLMNGTTPVTVVSLPSNIGPDWVIEAAADFNGDGKVDLVWRNLANGLNGIWLMNRTTVASVQTLNAQPDTRWRIVAAGDLNADGKPDLLWRNTVTGDNVIWYMNGLTPVSVASIPAVADTSWEIAGLGDFDGDGLNDIVWRNRVTGLDGIWVMNGTAATAVLSFATVAGSDWRIVAVGDYNQDGKPDLVWRNTLNGLNGIWLMDGTAATAVVGIPVVSDSAWALAGPK